MIEFFAWPVWLGIAMAVYAVGLAVFCAWFLVDLRQELDCLKEREQRRLFSIDRTTAMAEQSSREIAELRTKVVNKDLSPNVIRLKPFR